MCRFLRAAFGTELHGFSHHGRWVPCRGRGDWRHGGAAARSTVGWIMSRSNQLAIIPSSLLPCPRFPGVRCVRLPTCARRLTLGAELEMPVQPPRARTLAGQASFPRALPLSRNERQLSRTKRQLPSTKHRLQRTKHQLSKMKQQILKMKHWAPRMKHWLSSTER